LLPVPFNPLTSIQFSVSRDQLVRLTVHDVLGREVATLVNERKPAGNYRVGFDARNLNSGVYFYKLRAGGFVRMRRKLLLR
jgi:TctA family transporter